MLKGEISMFKMFENISKNFCRHKTILLSSSIEDGELSEPGGKTRKIKMGLIRTYCKKCDRTFKITPMGIIYDEEKGINRDFEIKTVVAPADVRKEVLSG